MSHRDNLAETTNTPADASSSALGESTSGEGSSQLEGEAAADENKDNWQEKALWDLQNTTMSFSEIADKYRRKRDTIIKLMHRAEVVRAHRAKSGPKPVHEQTPLSAAHRALGTRITLFEDHHKDQDLRALLGVSNITLKRMRHGSYDVPLTLLQSLSQVLGEPVAALLEPHKTTVLKKR